MQRQMLPDTFPDVPELLLAATTRPARAVGGDLYDVVRLDPHRVGLLLGDVAGKGLPAALEMARLLGEFRACVRACAEPYRVMQALNGLVCQRQRHVHFFVTVQYVVLDLTAHCLHVVCAGHPPVLLRRGAGHVEALGTTPNLPLGIEAGAAYRQDYGRWAPGECLLLYSDGVYEGPCLQDARLGLARLQERFAAAPPQPPAILHTVLAAGDEAQTLHDDTTLLCAQLRADRPRPRWWHRVVRTHLAHWGHGGRPVR
jgi:serine phosphatase RsbU (regulator of sigma subunit)